jgi:hypothetical protein
MLFGLLSISLVDDCKESQPGKCLVRLALRQTPSPSRRSAITNISVVTESILDYVLATPLTIGTCEMLLLPKLSGSLCQTQGSMLHRNICSRSRAAIPIA